MLNGAVPHTSPCTCGSQGRPVSSAQHLEEGRTTYDDSFSLDSKEQWRTTVLSALLKDMELID